MPLLSSSPYTVTRLNQSVRQLLEMEIGRIWLHGEISNLSQPASGHWYFTLKDDKAQIRCAMFRTSNRQVSFSPQNGQQVLVQATLTLYEPRGDYQLLADSMQPAGDGLLQQQFEQLKQRLQAEGLFDQYHKRALPGIPHCVGVITSSSGAALHDILHILKRRDPSLPVIIYPTSVQGTEASEQIVRALALANLRQECDVLILGRGGGSLEDLWSFNHEQVARAIFVSKIPIVTAIGHETDVTIADFVGDLRAPTPSAAAELVSRNQCELLRQLISQQQHLSMAMDFYLVRYQQRVTHLYYQLQQQHPQARLAKQHTLLLKLQHRLNEAIQAQLRLAEHQQERTLQHLIQHSPLSILQYQHKRLHRLCHLMTQRIGHQLSNQREHFATLCSQLEASSPLAMLARGFNVTQTAQGEILKSIKQVKPGDQLRTRVQDGWIDSQIVKTVPVHLKTKYKAIAAD